LRSFGVTRNASVRDVATAHAGRLEQGVHRRFSAKERAPWDGALQSWRQEVLSAMPTARNHVLFSLTG